MSENSTKSLTLTQQVVGLALIEAAIPPLVIVANAMLFWRLDRLAGLLFGPYVLWVAFAALLNAALWQLN